MQPFRRREADARPLGPVSEACSFDEGSAGPRSHLSQHSCPPGFLPVQYSVTSPGGLGQNFWAIPIGLQPSWVLGSPVLGLRPCPCQAPEVTNRVHGPESVRRLGERLNGRPRQSAGEGRSDQVVLINRPGGAGPRDDFILAPSQRRRCGGGSGHTLASDSSAATCPQCDLEHGVNLSEPVSSRAQLG